MLLSLGETALEHARRDARPLGDRMRFERGSADALGSGWDLVTVVDALHDLPEPSAALRRIRSALAPEGCALVVEPCVTGRPEVFVRLLSAISTLYCVPVGGAGEARGALGDEPELVRLFEAAGFARTAIVQRLPIHVVIAARP
jgi:hypothetical protein